MKMPIIDDIFIFISREKFMLSWAEQEKSFKTLGPGLGNAILVSRWLATIITWHYCVVGSLLSKTDEKLPTNNHKLDLHNINAHVRFGETPLTFTQTIIQKLKYDRADNVHKCTKKWCNRRLCLTKLSTKKGTNDPLWDYSGLFLDFIIIMENALWDHIMGLKLSV